MNSYDPIVPGPAAPADVRPVPARRPWGFWMTSVWVALALGVGIPGATFLTLALYPGIKDAGLDEWSVPAFVFFAILYAAVVLTLALAARSARWPVTEYFALAMPKRIDTAAGLALLLAWTVISFALLWLFGLGQADIDLLVDGHRKAAIIGTVPLLWILAVVAAPVVEEIVFRGFIYRGWSQARLLGAIRTIVITSVLFGLMHFHYTWFGIIDTMVFGLIAGWARWQSGTLVLPILLHAANNLIVMLYVMAQASTPLVVTGL